MKLPGLLVAFAATALVGLSAAAATMTETSTSQQPDIALNANAGSITPVVTDQNPNDNKVRKNAEMPASGLPKTETLALLLAGLSAGCFIAWRRDRV